MVTRMETAKKPVQTPKPTTTASSGEKNTAPAPKKVIKSVDRHAIFPAKTLESQEDIDAYVEHMRTYLTTMMKDHEMCIRDRVYILSLTIRKRLQKDVPRMGTRM